MMKNYLRVGLLFLCVAMTVLPVMAETVNLNFYVNGTRVHVAHVEAGSTNNLSSLISAAGVEVSACRDYTFRGWKVGEPVQGDEIPEMPSNFTAQANTNLYAVFEKATADRYVRITRTDNLEAGAKYLVVCYYMYGGEPQYYALGNENGTYVYQSTTYTKLNAERLYPHQGVITAPDNSLVWTLGGTSGAWTWHNEAAGEYLYIRSEANHYMLQAEMFASACIVDVANGVFSIKDKDNNCFLKYVDDEITETEDYFITGTSVSSDNYRLYLYKKESPYTSYPDCEPWIVYLDAVDGTITGKEPASETDTLTEASTGAGVTLPTATVAAGTCSDWSFAGWNVEAPIEGTNSEPANLRTGTYDPLYNGVTLHAVYGQVYYERVTRMTDIVSGDVVVIATTGNKAVTANMTGSHYYHKADIAVADGIITSDVTAAIEWTFDGTRFVNGSTYLSYSGAASIYYYVNNTSSPFTFVQDGYTSYYLYETSYEGTPVFGERHNHSQNFYIYKKKASYTSYPHCAPYSATLHACGGRVNGEESVVKVEPTSGAGFTLPAAMPLCSGWRFVGWLVDEELSSLHDIEFTDCHMAGTTFYPTSDHMDLYAVYERPDNRFRIIHGLSNLVSGENYLITYFAKDGSGDGKTYDFELSSEPYDASHLKGVKGVAPQNGEGYYMLASDSTVMWSVTGSGTSWEIRNLKNNQYLKVESDGKTSTVAEEHSTLIDDRGDHFALTVGCTSGWILTTHYNLYYDGEKFTTKERSTDKDDGYYSPFCYFYRRVKEFASWPHCDPFTVHFEACGGTADDGLLTEDAVYEGITLPEAYAGADCSKEGWAFVGWAESPVRTETDLQTFNLYPANTIYHPASTTDTLYAVYYLKTNMFKRIATSERLFTGTKYIITTSGHKALGNESNSLSTPTSVSSVSVSPDASDIITNTNAAIEWQLRGRNGEYELYNVARDVYLDMSEPGKVLLTKSEAVDQFDITYSGSSYKFRSVQNIAGSDGNKYLGFGSPYFTSVASGSTPALYIYRQQSNYCSYPECFEDIEALAWGVDENGSYVILESYLHGDEPDVNNSLGTPVDQHDGTYKIMYNPSLLTPCTRTTVEWSGKSASLKVPYLVENTTTSSSLLGATDCSECDVYVIEGQTFTIDADKTLHSLTVPDGATLNVADGVTLTVNLLILHSEGDQSAPVVNLNNSGSIVLEHGELYHDRRMDESRYFWFTLPFDAKLKEISYSNVAANGKTPVYREDYYLKYYDGAQRTEDANAGYKASTYWTHVAPKGSDYTLRAGQGYNIGIADQWNTIQADGKQHAKRVLRFTMRPENGVWLAQERNGGTKTTNVAPSTTVDPRNAGHAGWNLIGNPFMHHYNTGAVGANSGLNNGKWIKELDAKGDWTGFYVKDPNPETNVPYFTLYDPSQPSGSRYSQVLAANYDLRPFEAVFVQISEGEQINFASVMNVPAMAPAYWRFDQQDDAPLYTGIVLNGMDRTDRTGIVLSDEYTPAYEIGADLAKQFNNGGLNLYTLNPDNQELAFNGLSDADATEAIPVGVTFPRAGTYTFAFDSKQYSVTDLDTLQLIDADMQTSTNLLVEDYTFTTDAVTDNDRFYLLVRRAPKAPEVATGAINAAEEQHAGWIKIIRNGQLFIRRGNRMYDATGRSVE